MQHNVRDFETEVVRRSDEVPVLVDFWADWCGPCKMLAPVLDRLAAQAAGRWLLAKVNVDQHPDLAARFSIASIPAVKLFHHGKVVDEFLGMKPEAEIRRWLEKAVPSPSAASLDEATRLVAEAAFAEAARLLEPVVSAEPTNAGAALLLARCRLSLAPEHVEETLRSITETSDHWDKAAALRRLARMVVMAASPDSLPAAPVKARFIEGATAVRRQDFAAALEAFIDVLQRGRDYQEGAAKEACKAIFQVLGVRHPVSERYHRAFSSAVHA
jgi:putative thioredoxin